MHTLLLFFVLATANTSTPATTQPARSYQCCDTLVLDSLGRELDHWSKLTPRDVRALRRTTRRIADTSTCEIARDRAEELAFDMSMLLADLEEQR